MKKSSPIGILSIILIISIPLIYAASIYSSLPEIIPTHFNLEGKADGFGNKSTVWFISLFLSAISASVYLLIKNLPKIDPKKTAGQSPELFHKIAILLVVFLCAMNLIIIYSTKTRSFNVTNLILPLIGLLFMVLGNYMHSIKPNYFVGFRLPWTLENEDNWHETHHLVSKIWVAGGLLITFATLLLPPIIGFILFFTVMIVMVVVPAVFSYKYFKNHQQKEK